MRLGTTVDVVLPVLIAGDGAGHLSSFKSQDGKRVFQFLPSAEREIDRTTGLATLLDCRDEQTVPITVHRAALELGLDLTDAEEVLRDAQARGYVRAATEGLSITDRGRKKLAHDIDLGRYPMSDW